MQAEPLSEMEVLSKTTTISNYETGLIYTFMGEFEIAAGYFEKGIEKREPFMLFAKNIIMLTDEKMYNPRIAEVIENIEAFKRVK